MSDLTEPQPQSSAGPGKSHIGRVVVGSLLAGFLLAVVLIAFPLAHAQENVITGAVLLSFAFGWAALAAGSERWTDQPQRWAWVPAGFMGLAGLSVLLAGSTSDRLEWVWPPLLLALVVWIIVRARHDLHSRTRLWLLYPLCAVLVLMAIGGGYEAVASTRDGGKYAMPDQYTKLPGWSDFYAKLRRGSVLLPSLARLGLGRLINGAAAAGLPPEARGEERMFTSTPRAARSMRDEAAELRTTLEQAGALTSLGARPLIVVTAAREAERGWMPLQDDLATLSTNRIHRVLANATHSSLTEDKTDAAAAAQAIVDVVTAVRTDRPLAES